MNRIEWIDAIKGIGILCVCYNHHIDYPFHYSFLITSCELPLFFIVSGYLFRGKYNFKRLAFQLLLPYFIYGMIVTIADYFFVYPLLNLQVSSRNWIGLLIGRHDILKDLSQDWICGDAAPMWFLLCLFLSKNISGLVLSKIQDVGISWSSHRILFIKLAIIFSCLCLQFLMCKSSYLLPWCVDVVPMSVAFIITGTIVKSIDKIMNKIIRAIVLFCLLFAYVVFSCWNGECDYYVAHFGDNSILSIIRFYICGILYFEIWKLLLEYLQGTRLLTVSAYIGRQSLRILCIHGLVMNSICGLAFNALGLIKFAKLCVVFPITLSVSCLLGRIFNDLSNRTKICKYL